MYRHSSGTSRKVEVNIAKVCQRVLRQVGRGLSRGNPDLRPRSSKLCRGCPLATVRNCNALAEVPCSCREIGQNVLLLPIYSLIESWRLVSVLHNHLVRLVLEGTPKRLVDLLTDASIRRHQGLFESGVEAKRCCHSSPGSSTFIHCQSSRGSESLQCLGSLSWTSCRTQGASGQLTLPTPLPHHLWEQQSQQNC